MGGASKFLYKNGEALGLSIRHYQRDTKRSWSGEFSELETIYKSLISTWHPKRQDEFLLGRHLAHTTLMEKGISDWRSPILIGEKREPLFSKNISASLSHNKNFVTFGFLKGEYIFGLDLEAKERMKEGMEKQILREEDLELLKGKSDWKRDDLVTLIFSIKESIYKGLYPFVQEYFGFQDAYIESLDFEQNLFSSVVLKDFSRTLNLKAPYRLVGHFDSDESNIFSYLSPLDFKDFRGS